MRVRPWLFSFLVFTILVGSACSDDEGSEADRLGVGAQCESDDGCPREGQSCLTQFKGGYCGATGCAADSECPEGSACVTHEGVNYCFRICIDKAECNRNRSVENEANCSGNVTFVSGSKSIKACIPPSG